MNIKVVFAIFAALIRLLVFVTGIVWQTYLGFPIEMLRFFPEGFKQVPTRYPFSMSAKKGRWRRRSR